MIDGGLALFALLFALGLLGFIAMAAWMVGSAVLGLFRWIFGGAVSLPPTGRVPDRERRICRGPDCRHANVADARFCGRCGRRLDPPDRGRDYDAYG
ncbi:MAG: zinc ribbon domain-containing protein [Phycisphaerales bacterium]|nr:zinc ribbon domain-containing protein [Phycisphaerales bacterium]